MMLLELAPPMVGSLFLLGFADLGARLVRAMRS